MNYFVCSRQTHHQGGLGRQVLNDCLTSSIVFFLLQTPLNSAACSKVLYWNNWHSLPWPVCKRPTRHRKMLIRTSSCFESIENSLVESRDYQSLPLYLYHCSLFVVQARERVTIIMIIIIKKPVCRHLISVTTTWCAPPPASSRCGSGDDLGIISHLHNPMCMYFKSSLSARTLFLFLFISLRRKWECAGCDALQKSMRIESNELELKVS